MPYGKGFVETDDVDWWFIRSSSSSCVLLWSPRLSLSSFFIVFPKFFWAYGFALGGAVVVRGHPGDIPGFPLEIGILGYNGCCVLVAGNLCPQQSLFSFLFFSFVFLSSNNKLVHRLLRVEYGG